MRRLLNRTVPRSEKCIMTSIHYASIRRMPHNSIMNKTGTSKVGAISKAQEAQSFLNCIRGNPSGFLKIQFFLQNIKKNLKVGLFEGKKIEKSCTVPKKLKEGTLQSRSLSQMLESFWLKQ